MNEEPDNGFLLDWANQFEDANPSTNLDGTLSSENFMNDTIISPDVQDPTNTDSIQNNSSFWDSLGNLFGQTAGAVATAAGNALGQGITKAGNQAVQNLNGQNNAAATTQANAAATAQAKATAAAAANQKTIMIVAGVALVAVLIYIASKRE